MSRDIRFECDRCGASYMTKMSGTRQGHDEGCRYCGTTEAGKPFDMAEHLGFDDPKAIDDEMFV